MRFDLPFLPSDIGNKMISPDVRKRTSPENIASSIIDCELKKAVMDPCTQSVVESFKKALMNDDVHFIAELVLKYSNQTTMANGIAALEKALRQSGSETHVALESDGSLRVYSDNRTRAFLALKANPAVLIHPDGHWEVDMLERQREGAVNMSPERAYSELSCDMRDSIAYSHPEYNDAQEPPMIALDPGPL